MDEDKEKVYRENLGTEYPGFLEILDNLYNEFSEFLPDYILTFNSSYAKICPKYKRSRSRDLSIIKPRKNGVTIGFRITDPAFDYLSIKKKGIDISIDDPRTNWYSVAVKSFDDYKQNKAEIDDLIIKSEKDFRKRSKSDILSLNESESKVKYCWYLNVKNYGNEWIENFINNKNWDGTFGGLNNLTDQQYYQIIHNPTLTFEQHIRA